MYGLRKISKNGIHCGFQWPLEVGSVAVAPDWNPEPICGGGLHMLPNAQGDYDLLEGYYWAVVEFDEKNMVVIDENKAKVPSCKIVHLSEKKNGLLDWFKDVKFNSENAYQWALHIGDREHMRQFVTESQWAYYWAYYWLYEIGDREYMRQFITDPEWAYHWASHIGDREHMRSLTEGTMWEF